MINITCYRCKKTTMVHVARTADGCAATSNAREIHPLPGRRTRVQPLHGPLDRTDLWLPERDTLMINVATSYTTTKTPLAATFPTGEENIEVIIGSPTIFPKASEWFVLI